MKNAFFLKNALTMFVGLMASFAVQAANTWYVDDDNYGKSGLDGTTPEKAFGTIQDAIDAETTLDGDTIRVLPGTYDQGIVEVSAYARARVHLTKGVSIEATGSKEETQIVGYQTFGQSDDDGYGNGATAVKCVYVDCPKKTATLTGFTVCKGATKVKNTTNANYCGGGIAVGGGTFWAVDCILSENSASRYGSATYGGNFLRCQFVDNVAKTHTSACYSSVAIFCLFARNRNVNNNYHTMCTSSTLVNCTIANNEDPFVSVGDKGCYNCVFNLNPTEYETCSSNAYATVTTTNENAAAMLMAPALGDFRPLVGSVAVGCGETKYLTTEKPFGNLPSGIELRDMEGVLVDLTGEQVTAGAYQTAVAPQYGGIQLPADVGATVNGVATYGTNVLYVSSWPQLVKIGISNPQYYRVTSSGYPTLVPDADGFFGVAFPLAAGEVRTLKLQTRSSTYTVPSSSTPTLQSVTNYTSTSKLLLVNVAEGTYDADGVVVRGVTNRMSLSANKIMKFLATGEKEKTVVKGGLSGVPRDSAAYPGCGPDAVRCVNLSCVSDYSRGMTFVGMTFKDGRTDCGQDASDDQGGAAYGRKDGRVTDLMFVDCDFDNCYAPDAGVGVNACFIRCRFRNCGSAGVGFKNCIVSSCVFENCDFKGGTFGTDCITVNCSDPSGNAVGSGSGQIHVNGHFGAGTVLPSTAKNFGTSLGGGFADVSTGDLRPVSGSPAVDATRRPFPLSGEDDFETFAETYAAYADLALNGDGWLFGGAYPLAGAYQDWVRGFYLELDEPSAYEVTRDGDTLTVARKVDAVRHYGIASKGVTNMLDNGAYVYTLPADSDRTDGALWSVLDQNWYVNPNADPSAGVTGDDAANGFTAVTPKRTMNGVLSVATNAGDVVHAAAGVYRDGRMVYSDVYGAARAVVRGQITLVGEGPDKSIIEGVTNSDGGTWKWGGDAMRCVMLADGAVVSGFTLTNGAPSIAASDDKGSSSSRITNGGALWAYSADDGMAIDCKIVGSFAPTGAGVLYATIVGCEVTGNYSKWGGVTYAPVYHCFIDGNRSDKSTAQLYRPTECFDTTIGSSNAGSGYALAVQAGAKIVNSLVLGAVSMAAWTNASIQCANSAFIGTRPVEDTTIDCVFSDLAGLKLDGFAPLPRTSPLLGTASETILPGDEKLAASVQALRAARKMNGALDIGYYQGDWRPFYAQDIANRGMTVKKVSPDVVESGDRTVVLGDGMKLVGVWNGKGGQELRYQLRFKITGMGTLSVSVNSEIRTFESGESSWIFTSALSANDVAFSYSGEGTAEILQGTRMSGLVLIVR